MRFTALVMALSLTLASRAYPARNGLADPVKRSLAVEGIKGTTITVEGLAEVNRHVLDERDACGGKPERDGQQPCGGGREDTGDEKIPQAASY